MKQHNSHEVTKKAIRRTAIGLVDMPNVLQCHAGFGKMTDAVFQDLPGLMIEKTPETIDKLYKNHSNKAVYEGDSLAYLEGLKTHSFSVIDIDPFGDPFPHLSALIALTPQVSKIAVVITDGLIQFAKLGQASKTKSLEPAVKLFGANVYPNYEASVKEIVNVICATKYKHEFFSYRQFSSIAYYGILLTIADAFAETPQIKNARRDKVSDPFYKSKFWKILRAKAFDQAGRRCCICGDNGTEVDHIVPRTRGGLDTIDNLRVLCRPCHSRRTIADYSF